MHERDDPLSFQAAVADALRDLPGAAELRAFGSLTRTGHDHYADVDLEILTADPDASIAARQAIIERVAPIWLEWRIHPSHSAWAATILFTDLSPYRRLDLGISPAATATSTDARNARTVLWRQDAAPARSVPSPSPAYAPAVGTSHHAMLEHLLSATRYVKARKRGQHLTAFRFASALASATFAMLEARRTGDLRQLRQKPATTSVLALDRTFPDADRRDLLTLFDFSSPERMDASVLAILHATLALHDTLPETSPFPGAIADPLLTFIADELHT